MPRLPHVGEADCNMVKGCRWPFTTCIMCELQRVRLGICTTTKLCYHYMGTGPGNASFTTCGVKLIATS
jgi:hypothetical protein